MNFSTRGLYNNQVYTPNPLTSLMKTSDSSPLVSELEIFAPRPLTPMSANQRTFISKLTNIHSEELVNLPVPTQLQRLVNYVYHLIRLTYPQKDIDQLRPYQYNITRKLLGLVKEDPALLTHLTVNSKKTNSTIETLDTNCSMEQLRLDRKATIHCQKKFSTSSLDNFKNSDPPEALRKIYDTYLKKESYFEPRTALDPRISLIKAKQNYDLYGDTTLPVRASSAPR